MRPFNLFLIVAFLFISVSSLFVVEEGERGIVVQFSKIKRDDAGEPVVYEPGLHFKWPVMEKVSKQREQGRKSRKKAEVPTVSLVGYTNAGKSTLFNALTNASVYAADQLFATLDPTLRKIDIADVGETILADTVGFIRHLPHDLVAAFKATLTETREADLQLHVVDVADPRRSDNIFQVEEVLREIEADDIPQQFREQTRAELAAIIEPYNLGLSVVDVNFKDARPPEQVKDAFDDAIAAREDEVRYVNEAKAYASEVEPQARGQVNRMIQEATAYKQGKILASQGQVAKFEQLLPEYKAAPVVTRQRLYLETMEQVFSNTSKVLVDSEGSGNMMYLPLDKIMQQQGVLPQTQPRSSTDYNTGSGRTTQPLPNSRTGRTDRFNGGRD